MSQLVAVDVKTTEHGVKLRFVDSSGCSAEIGLCRNVADQLALALLCPELTEEDQT